MVSDVVENYVQFAGKIWTRLENMLKMGEHKAKCRALFQCNGDAKTVLNENSSISECQVVDTLTLHVLRFSK